MTEDQRSDDSESVERSTTAAATWEHTKELWHRTVNAPPPDENTRRLVEKTTWGLAGVAVVLIASIANGSLQSDGMRIALALFASCIPFLVLSGTLFHSISDPKSGQPEVGWLLKVWGMWAAGVCVFVIGMTIFLSTYNLAAGLLFVAALAFAYRFYVRYGNHLRAKSPSTQPAQIAPGTSHPQPRQVRAAGQEVNPAATANERHGEAPLTSDEERVGTQDL